jgi:phosphate butyryltransferase
MSNEPIYSSDALIERAITLAAAGRKRTVAVAAAQDIDVIGAVSQAHAEGFLDGILVGDESRIKTLSEEHRIPIDHLEVIHEPWPSKAAHITAALASEKKADVIMKGFLPTSTLLGVILDKQYGLRSENTLSHCAVLDIPGYHKLLNITDGGMVVKPTLEKKMQIFENAVLVARALGLSPVKIAIAAAVNKPSKKFPHTVYDVKWIVPMATECFSDVFVEGPMSLDLATSKTAAARYGKKSDVAGDADIYLVNSIEEGNIISKSLIQFSGAVFAGVIVGAKVPVSLVSRTDTVKNKKASLALACIIADYYEQNGIR